LKRLAAALFAVTAPLVGSIHPIPTPTSGAACTNPQSHKEDPLLQRPHGALHAQRARYAGNCGRSVVSAFIGTAFAQDDAAAARLSGGASPANCGASCKSSLTFSTRPFRARYMSLETIAPLGNDPNASLRQSLTDRAHAGECGGSSTTYTKLEATILTERIRQ
jgi:hypothetical protein